MMTTHVKPTLDQCIDMAEPYSIIPVSREFYSDSVTPIALLNRFNQNGRRCFLLESVESGNQWGRYSFIGFDPVKQLICKDGTMTVDGIPASSAPLDTIRQELGAYRSPRFTYLPSFTGGLVGYFGYDSINYFHSAVKLDAPDKLQMPDIHLMLFTKIICFDHFSQKITAIVNIPTEDIATEYDKAVTELSEIQSTINQGVSLDSENPRVGPFSSNMDKNSYVEKVKQLKQYITDGHIFQAVLARHYEASFEGNFLNVYRTLRTTNPSPYMYYLNMGTIEIAGASPETLVKVIDGHIQTCPIAGTRPRGKTQEEDERLAADLLHDEKECAEHNMLVDLARNDVGKVAQFGTVKVDRYMTVEKFSHVSHLTSEVSGTLDEQFDSLSVLASAFPAGTLSGAPKISAMNLLNSLEGCRRGIYGGSIGYIDFTGNMDMCICIRTIIHHNNKVHMGVGAGIVSDSQPEAEYEETVNKAGAMLQALEKSSVDLF